MYKKLQRHAREPVLKKNYHVTRMVTVFLYLATCTFTVVEEVFVLAVLFCLCLFLLLVLTIIIATCGTSFDRVPCGLMTLPLGELRFGKEN